MSPSSLRLPIAKTAINTAIPTKVEEAFKKFAYVPYISLTHSARLRASRGEDESVINAQGGLTAKGLDRRNEKSISVIDWLATSRAAEQRIRFYHGEARATAFATHHRIVTDLSRTHSWDIALDYDIQQRELVSQHPTHDISTLDTAALTVIATRPPPAIVFPPSPLKRSLPSDKQSSFPIKRVRSGCCFWCGNQGHLPHECVAESTTAGKPVAAIAPNAKSKNALLAPNGKTYCFNWTKSSSCPFGSSCTNFHGCSLCTNVNHGAGACKSHN